MKTYENERKYFYGYCKSAQKAALDMVAAYDESLNLNNLKTQKRLGRIYVENDDLFNEIELLDRVNYILNLVNLPALFLIFEKMDSSQYTEELKKLKQAFILVEKHRCLSKLNLETFIAQEEENFQARLWALKAMNNTTGCDKKDYKDINLHNDEDFPHKEQQSSLIKSAKPDRKPVKETVSFGCKVSAVYLKAIVILMNNKYHILSAQTSVDQLVMALMTNDWTKITFKIYLKCKTTAFKGFIKYLQRDFESLRLVNIGRSGLFISSIGTLINESNIGSANCSNWEKKHFSENILR